MTDRLLFVEIDRHVWAVGVVKVILYGAICLLRHCLGFLGSFLVYICLSALDWVLYDVSISIEFFITGFSNICLPIMYHLKPKLYLHSSSETVCVVLLLSVKVELFNHVHISSSYVHVC
jgi:hypothetical protein